MKFTGSEKRVENRGKGIGGISSKRLKITVHLETTERGSIFRREIDKGFICQTRLRVRNLKENFKNFRGEFGGKKNKWGKKGRSREPWQGVSGKYLKEEGSKKNCSFIGGDE